MFNVMFAEISAAWMLLGLVFAVCGPIFGAIFMVIYQYGVRHHKWRLETAKVSEEEVDVSENHAPRHIQRRPLIFMCAVTSSPPLVFADDAAGKYHNIVVSPQFPKHPIVFDSDQRALPGTRIKVVVKRDRLTGDVLEITAVQKPQESEPTADASSASR